MKKLSLLFLSILFISCNSTAQDKKSTQEAEFPIVKSEAEWKKELTEMQYYVLREAGTERAFTSPLNKIYEPGTYVCAACQTPLYKGKDKFDSGTGWPSFDRVIEGNVAFDTDNNLGYTRVEEHCATCGGHLGHVFDDGPKETTGKRHCINGAALSFIPQDN
ncbi:peptide-methionine (R)-S-oxide reductase MsrB [Ulvibacter antarcticus]|uniref:peptide-methionine (R)-S-oxide reductase n=1 Tax=Ulvibacter antarcticus TaxID=442714 RepID=A0A3L9YWH8_9FLAO|nr:peptide-methionine (R)-S-oxide reductase MsrB [Ulvibacter antarcticus]RMA64167.1 peptide-methionine (R)-S-oxide reductase [Ulvibacter antarcticus]